MSNIQNLQSFDPFKDTEDSVSTNNVQPLNYIHIRVQQRTGKKWITTIEGLNEKKYNFKAILKALKKEYHCNGNIENDEKFGTVIRLTGDKRHDVANWFQKEKIATKDAIKIHGAES